MKLAAAFLLLAALATRLAAARGDLWLDEVWSLFLAQDLSSPWQAFTLRHDNNHVVNTLFLRLCGAGRGPMLYRGLSVLCGVGAVWLMGQAAIGNSPGEKLAAMGLGAFSFPLILYSSEARGYAPAMLCALGAFRIARLSEAAPGFRRAVLFWLLVVLGFWSHLTFGLAYFALFGWEALAAIQNKGARHCWKRPAILHGFPLVFALGWLFNFVSGMDYGGAPLAGPGAMFRDALQLAMGWPGAGLAGAWAVMAGLFFVACGLVLLARNGDNLWLFFVLMLLAGPAVFALIGAGKGFHARYLVICTPFFLLLTAHALANIPLEKPWGRGVLGLVAGLFLVGNLSLTRDLVRLGRGHYGDAVRFMASTGKQCALTVGGDHDFRTDMMLWHYSQSLPPGKHIQFVNSAKAESHPPQWLLWSHGKDEPAPPARFKDAWGRCYVLAGVFPYAGFSGWDWFVFRLEGNPGHGC